MLYEVITGVSRAAVTLAINNLRLSGKAINGKKILYEEALRQWTSNTDPRREFGEQKVADINDIELQEPDDDFYDLEEDRKEPSSLSRITSYNVCYTKLLRVICGGFPCQPYSVAGKQKGKEDSRDLWPALFDVIKEYRNNFV